MDAQILYAILAPGAWPHPMDLHRTAQTAWQQYLRTDARGYALGRMANAAANRTGVRCRAFQLTPGGVCPNEGL